MLRGVRNMLEGGGRKLRGGRRPPLRCSGGGGRTAAPPLNTRLYKSIALDELYVHNLARLIHNFYM